MTKYFGVIGNRDYIKYQGERVPFWEFLDIQPYGWLMSLAYPRIDIPQGKRMIFDCGAWSYKDSIIPKLGKNLITPEWVFEQYQKQASSNDFVIAPDHMLIPNKDLDARREFNKKSASVFMKIVQSTSLIPMATIHGMDITERIECAKLYHDLGYPALALGGLAARASQKKEIVETVIQIRENIPDIWLHILGLSSPDYAANWQRIGVNSFDGSSHFKQAFTAGSFFTLNNVGKMVKYQAFRPGETFSMHIDAIPVCDCRACALLRKEGIDTRYYGSNESNMGRAAHNMNILMRAQQIAINAPIVLVSCVNEKMEIPDNIAVSAELLYQSSWFKKASTYARQMGRWYILSAEHGLLAPDEEIYTYSRSLNDESVEYRRWWAKKVADEFMRFNPNSSRVIILAGKKYREYLTPILEQAGYLVEVPMEGMGIGQQLAWLTEQNTKQLRLI